MWAFKFSGTSTPDTYKIILLTDTGWNKTSTSSENVFKTKAKTSTCQ